MIVVENLVKRFDGFTALDNLSFKAEKNKIYGLVGPNGAGKTTTCRILSGIMKPSSGKAEIMGLDVEKDGKKIRQITGYLPEEPHLYDQMSVEKMLSFFADLYDLGGEKKEKIDQLLQLVGLSERRGDRIEVLSKGMRHRLAFARTLLHDPEVLLLDEPTMGLDPATSRIIREFILGLRKEKTILLCTHYMHEADFLCDKIGVLINGRIMKEGSPESLKKSLGKNFSYEIVAKNPPRTAEKVSKIRECSVSMKGRKIVVESDKDLFEKISKKIQGEKILSFKTLEPDLEDVFIEYTRRRA